MDVNQYLGLFLEEAREHLQTLNRCVLDLEHDPGNLQILDEIFRSAHTIKGMSATMGYAAIAELTHEMENVLDLLRKGTLKAHAGIIDTLFQCVDRLEQLVEEVVSGQSGGVEVAALSAKLAALAKGEDVPVVVSETVVPAVAEDNVKTDIALNETEEQLVNSALAQGMQVFQLKIGIREGTLLKSVRAYMAMKALDELGDVIKTDPLVEDLEKDNFGQEFSVVLVTEIAADKVRETILSIAEIETVIAIPCASSEAGMNRPQVEEKTSMATITDAILEPAPEAMK